MISAFELRARFLDGGDACPPDERVAVHREAPLPGPRIQLPPSGQDWPEGTHFVELPTINETRRLLGPADETVRRRRSDVYFPAMPHTGRKRLQLGMHDRAEEYMFADGRICADDAAGHAHHFPAHLKVVRLRSHRIGQGQSWDVSASHTAWSELDYREELYVHVRVDRLVVEPGSSLEVHGNILVLECGEIEMRREDGNSDFRSEDVFEIRIMPTRHPAFSRIRSAPGMAGRSGADGADGADGSASAVIGTPFGPILDGSFPNQAGAPGADGERGGNGGVGQNGGMTMLADIRIGTLVGFRPASLRLAAQAGAGRQGGAGGHGGNGGAGGKGANGLDSVGGFVRGKLGGGGGNGGDGGDGGRGGNGGLGSNIFIQIRKADVASLDLRSMDSIGGPGGASGKGGAAGAGGAHGALAGAGPGESCASSGADGRDGAAGAPGKARAAPRIHVFTEP
jgi:hypothetical protein